MPKSYEICLRLSAEEKERLEHSARTCGLSKTAYLRRLILGKEVKALPSQEIKALRTEVLKSASTSPDCPQRQRRNCQGGGRQAGGCTCWSRSMRSCTR